MKFSYTLIKRLLPHVPPAKKLAESLNSYSFEVESVEGDMLDIKIPANQYSAMASHAGIAREASAIFRLSFKDFSKKSGKFPANKGFVKVKIEETEKCPRYATRVFDLKNVGESSVEIKKILQTCGINSVNAIVDLMNLVMLETGQPLHAFDAAKIKGAIHIRNAKKGEHIETLDKKTYALDSSTLVIADDEHALAIAGIKGGLYSGVTKDTKRIVVEAANFDGVSVYKSSRVLKLITDASLHYAHGISPALVEIGLDRATNLLIKSGAKLIDTTDVCHTKIGDAIIDFDFTKFEHFIGIAAPLADVKRFFIALGFSFEPMKKGNGIIRVRIPAWRNDIESGEDLYEEVARLMGHNELPKCPPHISIAPAYEDDVFILKDKVRAILSQTGFDEVYNSSFYGTSEVALASEVDITAEKNATHVEVENPVSDDRAFLRKSIVPLLMKNLEDNARYYDTLRIFEIGNVFANHKEKKEEYLALGALIAGKKGDVLILELKGVVDELLRSCGINSFSFCENGHSIRIESGKIILGTIGGKHFSRGWTAAYFEIDVEKMLAFTEERREYTPLKRFPAIIRDISVLLGRDARIGDVIEEIEEVNSDLIEAVDLIDEYKDEKLGGKQSITFRIIFQADDRTLTDGEANTMVEKISQALRAKFGAEMR